MVIEQLNAAFHPRSIAVVGAFSNSESMGVHYITHLVSYGYRGQVYPVASHCKEVLGFKTYSTLKEVPGPIDYVICCLAAPKVPGLLRDCSQKADKVVQLYTGRFSEAGWEGATRLETEVLSKPQS